jgi:hypothetical protein
MLSSEELAAITRREAAAFGPDADTTDAVNSAMDVPALLTEVRQLRLDLAEARGVAMDQGAVIDAVRALAVSMLEEYGHAERVSGSRILDAIRDARTGAV